MKENIFTNGILHAQYYAYRLGFSVMGIVPPRWMDALGGFVGGLAYHLMPARREIVTRNLQIIAAYSGEHDVTVKDIFIHAGQNLLGSIRMSHMSAAEIQKYVTAEGFELMRNTGENVGVVAVLAHMGNWEILTRMGEIFLKGKECAAIYRPLENPLIDAHVKKSREISGTKLLARREAVITSSQILRRGGVLGILCDQHAGRQGASANFFGRPTSCTPLPLLLQQRCGAEMVSVSVTRDAPAHWHVQVRPVAVENLSIGDVIAALEKSLLTSLRDGFWLHDRWKIPGSHLFTQHLDCTASVPYQAVVILSNQADVKQAAVTAFQEVASLEHLWKFHYLQAGDDLTEKISALKNEINLPIDIIIHAHTQNELFSLTENLAPRTVGYADEKLPSLKRTILWAGKSPSDVATWSHMLSLLGLNYHKKS